MKLRLDSHSIRFRLTRSEVESIGSGKSLSETLRLAGGEEISFELRVDPRAAAPDCSFRSSRIAVSLPAASARNWAKGDDTGIYAEWDDGKGRSTQLLVEKDFKCLHESAGETEKFDNPSAKGR